jgi:nicotinamidase/pyrazinamidase
MGSTNRTTPGVLFWDVDTQCDFMHSNGRLYVPEAEDIIPLLGRLTAYAHDRGIRIVASADDHVVDDPEISDQPDGKTTFPPHCMHGTPGQCKIPETALVNPLVIESERVDPHALADRVRAHRGDILFHKHRFDVFTNENVTTVLEVLDPHDIVLYGVALDVCDKAAIAGLLTHRPQARLFAVTDAMKAIDQGMARTLLGDWAKAGVRLVRTQDVLEGGLVAGLARAGT